MTSMLVKEHRFRSPSLELTCMGTSLRRQKRCFMSLGNQYGCRVIKAYTPRTVTFNLLLRHSTFFAYNIQKHNEIQAALRGLQKVSSLLPP